MIKVEIKDKVLDLIKDNLKKDLTIFHEDIGDELIFGEKLKFHPTDLVYLYFCIERLFNIHIPEKYVLQGEFKTINGIVNVINECISSN
jgi:peptide maturation system acyl carrier-related protein